jgi:hypothetical protein
MRASCVCAAGIFGGPTAGQAAPPPRARDNGIFGAPVQNAPDTRNAVTKSSVEGGIFSEPMAKAPDSARNGVTKSSIEGGVRAARLTLEPRPALPSVTTFTLPMHAQASTHGTTRPALLCARTRRSSAATRTRRRR